LSLALEFALDFLYLLNFTEDERKVFLSVFEEGNPLRHALLDVLQLSLGLLAQYLKFVIVCSERSLYLCLAF